jgi:hypothetical protein
VVRARSGGGQTFSRQLLPLPGPYAVDETRRSGLALAVSGSAFVASEQLVDIGFARRRHASSIAAAEALSVAANDREKDRRIPKLAPLPRREEVSP